MEEDRVGGSSANGGDSIIWTAEAEESKKPSNVGERTIAPGATPAAAVEV